MSDIEEWVNGRLPEEWFTGPAEVTVDREEILVVGTLEQPAAGGESAGRGESGDSDAESSGSTGSTAAAEGRIARFREQTRRDRMRIADEAESRYGKKVAWGAACGEVREVFTHLSIPVMTRLRQPDRITLDTLVDAGVARSRSDALAWCVRLVGRNESEWIEKLREALVGVEQVRSEGPRSAS